MRNRNASTKLKPPAPPIAKCVLCGEDTIFETDDPATPFGCMNCGAWGLTEHTVDNPSDDYKQSGQVSRKPPSE